MTPNFIDAMLFRWGYMDHSTLLFADDGFCPYMRVGWTSYRPHGIPLVNFAALTWPA